jgi:fatty acid desaturase
MTALRVNELNDIDLSKLTEIRQGSFLVKLLIMTSILIGSITIILCNQGIASFIAMIFLGLMYAHALVLQHSCLHNTALRTKQSNRIVGFLLGLPMLVSYSDYQVRHFKHHKMLGTSEYEESFNHNYNSLNSLKFIIPHFWMFPHYKNVAIRVYKTMTYQPL